MGMSHRWESLTDEFCVRHSKRYSIPRFSHWGIGSSTPRKFWACTEDVCNSLHRGCLQCPPHQCVDDLGSHTCGWSAQGFLPYSKYDVNVLILYGRYQGPLATGHRLVGLRPATLSEKWHLLRCHQMTHESAQEASRTDILKPSIPRP